MAALKRCVVYGVLPLGAGTVTMRWLPYTHSDHYTGSTVPSKHRYACTYAKEITLPLIALIGSHPITTPLLHHIT